VSLPRRFKCLPILLRAFNCLAAFLQILEICVLKLSLKSMVTPKQSTKKIEKIQERALRFMYDDFQISYECLLEKSKLPSLKTRRMRTIALETFKIMHCMYIFVLHTSYLCTF
jgi:NAD kinase